MCCMLGPSPASSLDPYNLDLEIRCRLCILTLPHPRAKGCVYASPSLIDWGPMNSKEAKSEVWSKMKCQLMFSLCLVTQLVVNPWADGGEDTPVSSHPYSAGIWTRLYGIPPQ